MSNVVTKTGTGIEGFSVAVVAACNYLMDNCKVSKEQKNKAGQLVRYPCISLKAGGQDKAGNLVTLKGLISLYKVDTAAAAAALVVLADSGQIAVKNEKGKRAVNFTAADIAAVLDGKSKKGLSIGSPLAIKGGGISKTVPYQVKASTAFLDSIGLQVG